MFYTDQMRYENLTQFNDNDYYSARSRAISQIMLKSLQILNVLWLMEFMNLKYHVLNLTYVHLESSLQLNLCLINNKFNNLEY